MKIGTIRYLRFHFNKIALAASVSLALAFTFGCSTDNPVGNQSSSSSSIIEYPSSSAASSSSNSNIAGMAPLRAQPVAASKNGEPKVLESWTEEDKNWYIIDVGYIDNSLVMETDHERYEGLVEITFTKEISVKTSISESRTASVSNSIVVSNSSTETVGIEAAIKAAVKAKYFGVESSIEGSLKSNQQISQTLSISQERTTYTSQTLIESFEKSVKEVSTLKFDKNVPAGYYRYAWYTTWDVYFVISTSLDNQELLSWDVVSCPRKVGTKGLEYSPDNKFDNSPRVGDEIVFSKDFYKTLQIPNTVRHILSTKATAGGSVDHPDTAIYKAGTQVSVTAKPDNNYAFNGWIGAPSGVDASRASITFVINSDITLTANFRALVQKTETVEYTTAGDNLYTFNKNYPGTESTVDVWVLGGGGGGQGGHRWRCGLIDCDGTGGGGGGGAAAHANFKVTEPVTFNATVGKGGSAGGYGTTKSGGGSGGTGGNSRITASGGIAFVLTAGGGGGGGTTSSGCASGGQNAQNYGCGAGGSASQSGISATLKNGNYGAFGSESDNAPVGGGGGSGGTANGYSGGAGGIGGYGTSDTGGKQRPSGTGGTGKIRIVIKYFE